jgi:adenosylcobinamide-phosphate synthase
MALKLGVRYSSKARGVLVWVTVMAFHVIPFALALIVAYRVHPLAWVVVSAVTLKLSMSLRLLIDICYNAYRGFSKGLDEARRWVQMIVRRDVSRLDEPRVVSAALESLAESLVDGFTSPLFYYALLGPLGALVQRVANTLDGALGYKTPEYRDVGWFSARMDTLINYIPARITALMIIALAPVAGGSFVGALTTWRRWSRATESVNAGHPMSALAGALNVRLEKPGYYVLNASARNPEPHDIVRGVKLALTLATLYTVIIAMVIAIVDLL